MAKRKTAMASEPKKPATGGGYTAKPNMPLQRLSPGVYRSASGGLVTQKGRPLPQKQMGQRITDSLSQGASANRGANIQAPMPSPQQRAEIEQTARGGFRGGVNVAEPQNGYQTQSDLMNILQQGSSGKPGYQDPMAAANAGVAQRPPYQPNPGDRVNYGPDATTGMQMPQNKFGMYPQGQSQQDFLNAAYQPQQPFNPDAGFFRNQMMPQQAPNTQMPYDLNIIRQNAVPYNSEIQRGFAPQGYTQEQMQRRYAEMAQQQYPQRRG